jgi:hypothetical protein
VVVDDAARLQRRVHRRRADEAEARGAKPFRERRRSRRGRVPLGVRPRRLSPTRRVFPEELLQRGARFAEGERRACIRDRRLDLAPVTDDRGVRKQPLDVALSEPGDPLRVEAAERRPEALALAQDRQPRQPGLEALERQPLVQAPLVADRAAPFLVVIGEIERIGRFPAADQGCTSATITLTIPSRTTTW